MGVGCEVLHGKSAGSTSVSLCFVSAGFQGIQELVMQGRTVPFHELVTKLQHRRLNRGLHHLTAPCLEARLHILASSIGSPWSSNEPNSPVCSKLLALAPRHLHRLA